MSDTSRRGSHALRLALGLALVGLVIWALDSSWSELSNQIRFDGRGLPLVLLGTSVAALCTAWRWKWIGEQLRGTHLPFMTYFYALVLTRLIGLFTSTLAVDLVGRGMALQRGGSDRPVSHTTTVVVVERLYDVLLPTALLGWALFARHDARLLALSVMIFVVASVLAHRFVVRLAGRAYTSISARIAARRAGSSAPVEGNAESVAPELLAPRAAFTVVAASVGRYLGMWIYCVGVARSIGLDLDLLSVLAITPLAQLSALFGFTPGGLGIQEVGWAGGLQLVGVGAAATVLFIVAQRAAFISSFALLSLLSYPFRGRVEEAGT